MNQKKLAKVYYADRQGLREEKYKYLFENDARKSKWIEVAKTIQLTIELQEKIEDVY